MLKNICMTLFDQPKESCHRFKKLTNQHSFHTVIFMESCLFQHADSMKVLEV